MIELIVREFVEKACKKPENLMTEAFYQKHIQMVVDFSDQLCLKLKADREIVRIAAYMHDISAILDFSTLSVHPVNSAEIAKSLLTVHQYPKDRVNKVCQSILTHSIPMDKLEGSAEQVCVSNADAMAFIASPSNWLYYAFSIRKMNLNEGLMWYRNKAQENWKLLIDPAKEIIHEQYHQLCNIIEIDRHSYIEKCCFLSSKN
jgi:uncharacterized protein